MNYFIIKISFPISTGHNSTRYVPSKDECYFIAIGNCDIKYIKFIKIVVKVECVKVILILIILLL